MPAPKRSATARAGSRSQYPAPVVDCGRYPAKRTVGDTVAVSADIFRDGHEMLRAVVRYKAPGGRQLARGRRCAPSTRTSTASAGRARSRSTRPAAGSSRSRPGPTSSPPGATSCARKVDAGHEDLAGELSEGVVLLERAPSAPRAPTQGARSSTRSACSSDADAPRQPKHDAALGPELFDAVERRPERHGATHARPAARRSRSTACARASAPGTSSSRARGAASRASRSSVPRARRARLRRPLPAADPPDRRQRTARAATTRSSPARTTPARRGRSAARRAATTPSTPSSARSTTSRAVRDRARARHGRRARLRDPRARADHPWLTEHPEWFHRRPDGTLKYAENPPKKYQDIYNVNWDSRGLARPVGGAAATSSCSGSTHGVKVFRVDNPHTKPFAVLGVADRRGPQGRPRRDLPRRGVHAPRRDARARQDRLHPVLHVLHLEELALGADRVRQRARLRARSRSTSGRTSSPTRRTSSTPTSRTAARPAFARRLVLAATL